MFNLAKVLAVLSLALALIGIYFYTNLLVALVAIVALLLFNAWFKSYWPFRKKEGDIIHGHGLWLGPVQSIIVFISITLLFGAVLTQPMYWLVIMPLNPDFFGSGIIAWTLSLGLWLLASLLPWLSYEKRVVPNNHVVPLKFAFGLINCHLANGGHLIPFYPLLSTNRDAVSGEAVYNSQEKEPEDPANTGLIYVGQVTVHLGESGTQNKMVAIGFDNTSNKLLPTFTWNCVSPLQRLGRNRPIKDINEAARTAARAIVGQFTARQLNDFPEVMPSMLDGARVYFVRTRRSDAKRGVHGGDVVCNRANQKPIVALGPKEIDTTIEAQLLASVKQHGYDPMLDAASQEKGQGQPAFDHSTIEVTTSHVADMFKQALRENGFDMHGLPRIGDIEIPSKITDAGASAAAEVEERASALATAETVRQQGEILKEAGLKGEDAAWAAFFRENPAAGKAIHLTGGSRSNGVIINS